MVLKAVLFDFNGIIVNDESIHQELVDEILLGENLLPSKGEFRQLCLGRTDRACLVELLARRGRVTSNEYLTKLLHQKAKAYEEKIALLENIPTYVGIADFIKQIHSKGLIIALVTGAFRREVDQVLTRLEIASYFQVIISGENLSTSKPDPEGYLLALKALELEPKECIAIEDSLAGIQAAKRAKIQVIGVANTYPFHMLQRQANWVVDYLSELELERVEELFKEM